MSDKTPAQGLSDMVEKMEQDHAKRMSIDMAISAYIAIGRSMEMEQLERRVVACKHWRWMPGMCAWTPTGARAQEWPDLSDPATLGCLLHLVREAWGDDHIVVLGGWTHVHIYPREEAMQAWDYGDLCEYAWSSKGLMTEAEALVAALEAAP